MGKNRSQKAIKAKIKNELVPKGDGGMISNGLTDVVMSLRPGNMGTQISQTDTLFANNRWYLISNMRQLLSEIYVEQGPIQTMVDLPVDDGLRGGVEINTKQLGPEDIVALIHEMEKCDDFVTIGQALKWNRLYGGAGIIIVTDQDPEEPLDLEAITDDTPLEFKPCDMWELFWDKQEVDDNSITIQEEAFQHYRYYGVKVHKTRVLKMKGLTPPSFLRPRLRGWGLSVTEVIVKSINQYLKANNLIFEILDEFKLDIFKIKGFNQMLLTSDGSAKASQRLSLANAQKNFQNAMAMDMDDDYVQKQLSFAGLADTMKEIRTQLAADLRIPMAKLFGISAAGLGSGEDDIENYNAMIEGQVRAKVKFDVIRIIQIRCQKMFGIIPDDLTITFKPLRILSSEQEENIKTQKFNRALTARQAGELTSLEFRNACNADNLFAIQLDTDKETLSEIDDSKEASKGIEEAPKGS